MPSANVVEVPIVGARTPEIVQAAESLKSMLSSETTPSANRLRMAHGAYANRFSLDGSYEIRSSNPCHLALVNTFTRRGRESVAPSKIAKLVEEAFALQHTCSVIVCLDDTDPEAVRAARDAGADEFVGRDAIRNTEALYWRVCTVLIKSHACALLEETDPSEGLKPTALKVGPSTRLSAEDIRAADARIDAAVAELPTAEDRRARGHDLLRIVAPELRDPESGRLNAHRIREATGLSLAALARASGVTQQALSATPDSPGAQTGLLPIARLSVLLDEMFTPEHKRIWLQSPHPRFDDRSPAQAIEAGDAELVALSIESALEGIPD